MCDISTALTRFGANSC